MDITGRKGSGSQVLSGGRVVCGESGCEVTSGGSAGNTDLGGVDTELFGVLAQKPHSLLCIGERNV